MTDWTVCCTTMGIALQSEDIIHVAQDQTYHHGFWIHGHPMFDHDGEGYIDDSTGELRIHFCPFCGKKLPEREDE